MLFKFNVWQVYLLVCYGYHNEVPQTRWLKQSKLIFFTVLEVRSAILKCHWGWFLVRPFSLVYRWLPFHCIFTWPLLWTCTEGEESLFFLSLLIRTTVPSLMTSLNLYYLFKGSSPKQSYWGLGLQFMNFWRTQ